LSELLLAEITTIWLDATVFSKVISDIARFLEDPTTIRVETLEELFGPKLLRIQHFYDSMHVIGDIVKMLD